MKTLFAWIAAAGLAGAALTAENWTKPQQEVADVFKVWAESELAGDVDREMSILAPAFTAWEFSQPAPLDYAAFRQLTVDIFKQNKVTACVIQPDIIRLEGTTAIAHGRYTQTMQDAAGISTDVGGPWTASLIQREGRWLVLALAWANEPPAAAAGATENWTKDQQAVVDVFKTWEQAELARDHARIMSLMAPDMTFWNFKKPGPLDRAGFEKMMTDFAQQMKTSAFSIRTDSVLTKGEFALAHGHYAEAYTNPKGTLIKVTGPWTATLLRAGDKWLVLNLSYHEAAEPAGQAAIEQEVAQLEHAWARAYLDRDVATMDRLEAEEWICTTADGELFTKAEDIADVKSGAFQATVFKMEDVKVRVYGDMAVATALQTEEATYKGKEANKVLRCTDTWVRRDGRWQCVATHLSYAKKG